ncbi:MAG: retroviral-like aspartic protease family protein [bacterium]
MGKTTEKVIVKNFGDILKASEGLISEEAIRMVEVDDAVVDTGAAFLCLPPEVIAKLGLMYAHSRKVLTANGEVNRRIFSVASITIQGREIRMDVMENDETTPPLIGYLVLENMDLVVEAKSQKVTPNPEHDGKWVTDLF